MLMTINEDLNLQRSGVGFNTVDLRDEDNEDNAHYVRRVAN